MWGCVARNYFVQNVSVKPPTPRQARLAHSGRALPPEAWLPLPVLRDVLLYMCRPPEVPLLQQCVGHSECPGCDIPEDFPLQRWGEWLSHVPALAPPQPHTRSFHCGLCSVSACKGLYTMEVFQGRLWTGAFVQSDRIQCGNAFFFEGPSFSRRIRWSVFAILGFRNLISCCKYSFFHLFKSRSK